MSEFRDPTTYNGISQKSFVAPTKLTAYLKILPDMGLVEREYPALTSTKMQGNAARGLDKISDRFLKFWFRFIASQSTEIPTVSAAATVWEHAVAPFSSNLPRTLWKHVVRNISFAGTSMGNCLSLLLLSDVGGTKTKKSTLWQLTPSRKTCWSVNANIEQFRLA